MLEATLNHRIGDFTLAVDLRLQSSGVCAIFGPSGCGKTTLLKALAGLLRTQGHVKFNGQCWQDQNTHVPAYERAAGFVFQDNRLFPHLDVAGNLDFARQRAAKGRIEYQEVIDTLGVQSLLSRGITGLSGGEAKRVAIARALVSQPKILLMDEPLSGLDHASKHDILGYLRRLNQHFALPTLYVSHDIEEVARLCDRMVMMRSGQVVDMGPTAEIIQKLNQTPDQTAHPGGAVIHAKVSAHRADFSLTELDLAGHKLFAPIRSDLSIGETMQLFLPARDVALATQKPEGLSIRNTVPGIVDTLHADANDRIRVAIKVADQMLFAQITRQASEALALKPGLPVFALVKSVALD